jgi:DNA-binding NarL/FixJ family response regulator
LRDAVAERRPALVEITNYKRDGTAFRNAVMIAPLFDPEGRIEFFVGSQMDVELAQPDPRQRLARMVIATLSSRQVEVLQFMAHGLRHAEIAHRLGINEKTVKMHRAVLVKRLGCRTSAEAIRIAIEAGL